MSTVAQTNEPLAVVVTVPAGAVAGPLINVDTPTGQQVQVTIPAGVERDQEEFRVELSPPVAKVPTETQINPLSRQPVGLTDRAAPGGASYMLPGDGCCSSQFSVWGVASPQTSLQALRHQHESDHGTGTAADDQFFPPTVEGFSAFKQHWMQAQPDAAQQGGPSLDKQKCARAGGTLVCDWIRLHPTLASAICLLGSLWFADAGNLFLLFLATWIGARSSPHCKLCWCTPAGRCKCPKFSLKCCGSCTGIMWVGYALMQTLLIMSLGCQTSCALTGWLPGNNQMEQPLEKLFAPEYYGLCKNKNMKQFPP